MASTAHHETFATLRGILEAHAKTLTVTADKPGVYQLSSRTLTDRMDRPLFAGGVQTGKNDVRGVKLPWGLTPDARY